MAEKRSIVAEGEDQYRAFAHPLRRRILELALEPITAKDLAARLEVSATRLYRHIDVLRKVGLLEVVREVPKRGVVERWFRCVERKDDYAALKEDPEGMVRIGAAQVQIKLPVEEATAFLQRLVNAATPYVDGEGDAMTLTISLDAEP